MTTVCTSNKIDSNISGLSIAEEECLKMLPDDPFGSPGDQAGGTWFGQEPNSYKNFGGELTTVARSPIDPSRQNKKGTVVDLSASGGFNVDVTKSNCVRVMQGFMFASAREKPTSDPITDPTVRRTAFTSVTSGSKTYAAAAGLAGFNLAGYLVFAHGFAAAANNGVKTVASATAGTIVVNEAIATEATPANGVVEVVGFQGAAADLAIGVVGNIASLVSTALDFTTLPLIVGEWIFVGGDTTASRFLNNQGFARIGQILPHALVFDDVTWSPVNEAATGLSIRLYFGKVIKNEKSASLIKRRSYQLERTLGEGANGPQAEYLVGAIPNELTINIPVAEKITADLSFVACDQQFRSGDVGDELKPGLRISSLGEDAINSSSNIYRIKMSVLDPSDSTPEALFAYVTDGKLTIQNGVKPLKAVGVLGAFDTNAGNFTAGGSVTAYFTTVAAVKAVRNNADIGLSVISTSGNSGFLFDIPLLGIKGGRVNVTKDEAITVPLEPAGAENKNGYTMLYQSFAYLPTLAMPS